MAQVRTLLTLAADGPQTLSSVAERLHLHESTIDAIVFGLVARGFVVEIPTASNAGVSIVALSIGGRRRVDDAIRHEDLIVDGSPARIASIGAMFDLID